MINILLECVYLSQIIFIICSSAFLVRYMLSYILQENETKTIEYVDTNVRIGFGHTLVY